MEISAAVAERTFSLPGIAVIQRMQEQCRLEAISLQEGGMAGAFGHCRHGSAEFSSFTVDFALHGRFAPPSTHYLSCYVHEVASGSWCAGMPLVADTMLIVLPDSACELMLGPGARVSMALAPLHGYVKRAVDGYSDSFGLPSKQFALFGPQCHAGTPLRALYELLFAGLVGERDHELSRLAISGSLDFLIDERGMRALSAHATPLSSYGSHCRAHFPAFRRAVQFMRENLQRDIYMEEVAAAAQISDRSLRLAFDDLLGISPTRYLSLLRLHQANRQLSTYGVRRQSVKSVAMSCGMWNLSRFAANYRRAFGEHPSDTLMRACSFAS